MAQQTAASAAALRALTYRITSTPTKQLPKIASQIAGAIWTCRHLLSAPSDAKKTNDAQTAVHRFKTQLSTLLQDRTVEGRWAAVVLVKAAIEAGGSEVLSKSNPWVRSLLGILKKPDPPNTRVLVVLILTRIFTLTWENATLIREITTPALTAFIPTCLANFENRRCSSAERQTILDAFATLVSRHPTIFRTNESKLRTILAAIISSTASDVSDDVHYNEGHRSSATKLWVLLNNCAPKAGGSEKWDETFKATVKAAHATCDQVFRSVQEEWQSVAGVEFSIPHHALSSGDVEISGEDAASLKPWKGIYAGGERLVSLLDLLKSHVSSATPASVSLRVGHAADLLTRIFGITAPVPGKTDFIKFNNQISREEREAMFSILPRIHIAAIEVALSLLQRLNLAVLPWMQILLDQAVWVFRAESSHFELRQVAYELFSAILDLAGPALSKSDVADLDQVLKACCQDLFSDDKSSPNASSRSAQTQSGSRLNSAAQDLLQKALSKLDSSCIAPKLRAQVDRVAVLTRNKNILLSSVMNVARKQNGQRVQPSLLPILAREYPRSHETEPLLRPRMPPVITGARKSAAEQTEELEAEDLEEDVAEDSEEPEPEDLLDALVQDPATSAFEASSHEESEQTFKRRADEQIASASSAKRFRASPVAQSLLPESSTGLPGPAPSLQGEDVPETVVVESSQTIATLPIPPSTDERAGHGIDNARECAEMAPDAASDDSDFEMPPLTMEPDTDEDED